METTAFTPLRRLQDRHFVHKLRLHAFMRTGNPIEQKAWRTSSRPHTTCHHHTALFTHRNGQLKLIRFMAKSHDAANPENHSWGLSSANGRRRLLVYCCDTLQDRRTHAGKPLSKRG